MQSQTIHRRLEELLDLVAKTDFVVSEESQRLPQLSQLVPDVLALLEEGVDILGAVQQRYESDEVLDVGLAGDDDPDSLSDIGAMISLEMAARGIADLAFVARGDLMYARQELKQAAARHDYWRMASRCDAGFRHLRKALISVESAIYEFEGRKPPLRPWFDLATSVKIRQLYGRLRTKILADEADPSLGVVEKLARTKRRLVKLRGLHVYPLLRFDDRLEMRRLYKRILDTEKEGGGEESPRRLWKDVLAFAQLLAQVNHREELREHDQAAVATTLRLLSASEGALPAEARERLLSLRGLDAELDVLLDRRPEPRAGEWVPLLERLRRSLSPRSPQGGSHLLPPVHRA